METEQISSEDMQEIKNQNHGALGEIVLKFHLMVKPALEQGNYFGANMVITESDLRLCEMVGEPNGGIKNDAHRRVDGVFWNCKAALALLNEAVTNSYSGDKLKNMLYQAEERFKKIDHELQADKFYMDQRGPIETD